MSQLTENAIVAVLQKILAPPLSIHCLTNPYNRIVLVLVPLCCNSRVFRY